MSHMTMTQEEKDAIIAKGKEEADAKIKLAEKAKADAEFEDSLANLSDEEKEAKRKEKTESEGNDDKDVSEDDLKEMLRIETERREKAEKALAGDDFKKREADRKKKEKEDADEEDEDKPLTKKQLREMLASERQNTVTTLNEKEIEKIAGEMSGSETEKQLIIATHKNRTFPADLSVKEQVEEAFAIVNRKKIILQNAELKRALKSKENASRESSGDQHTEAAAGEFKLSPQDAQAIKSSGMVWDGVKRAYKKPIGNGKTFYFYDPKTKKRWKGV